MLDSLGHAHDWVQGQEEARQRLGEGYDYVLLDLEIPQRAGRGLPRIGFGEQLARDIYDRGQRTPVLVMTAHGREGLEIADQLCACGVVAFINKPFPQTGRTLEAVIRSVVVQEDPTPAGPREFAGGELVLETDRALLLGVPILWARKARRMWTILNLLASGAGKARRSYSGSELAQALGPQIEGKMTLRGRSGISEWLSRRCVAPGTRCHGGAAGRDREDGGGVSVEGVDRGSDITLERWHVRMA